MNKLIIGGMAMTSAIMAHAADLTAKETAIVDIGAWTARALAVPDMIRSRRKVEAIIHDANCFIALRREHGTFAKWLWSFTDGKTLHNPDNVQSDEWTVPTRTELSDRIAAELRARGFKFLGSVTVYAFMQSVGLVNDHARFCFRYRELTRA